MHVQEDQATERRAEKECWPRHAHTIHSAEDAGCLSLDRKCVEGARADIQVGIGSAHHEDENSRINNVIQDLDPDQSRGCTMGQLHRRDGGSKLHLPTTNGEAAAPVFDLLATNKSLTPSYQSKYPSLLVIRSYIVCPRNEESDNEDATNVEHHDPQESPPDSNRDVLTRILRLAHRHTDQFRADVRKQRVGERAPKAEENGKVGVVHSREQI